MRWVQVKQDVSKLNVNISAWFMLIMLIPVYYCIGVNVYTIKKNTEALGVVTRENGLEVNADKTKYMVMSRDYNIKLDNWSFERVEQFKYLETEILFRKELRLNSGNVC